MNVKVLRTLHRTRDRRPPISVEWKPGAPMPAHWRATSKAKGKSAEGVVRLFAFGMPKAREKARASVRDWREGLDWFVA